MRTIIKTPEGLEAVLVGKRYKGNYYYKDTNENIWVYTEKDLKDNIK